jgi:hypothetical protein
MGYVSDYITGKYSVTEPQDDLTLCSKLRRHEICLIKITNRLPCAMRVGR